MTRCRLATVCTRLVGLAFLLIVTGCENDHHNRASITGEVRLDGQPIEQGSIQFEPVQGVEGSISDGQIVKGHYYLSDEVGPVIGWNRVAIRVSRKTGKTIEMQFPRRGAIEEEIELVAPRFNSESTLKVEITPGESRGDFEVNSK